VTFACNVGWITLAAALLVAGVARAEPPRPESADGPQLDLAPEHDATAQPPPASSAAPSQQPFIATGAGTSPDTSLVRGLTAQRMRRAAESESGTSIGGYGEIHFIGLAAGKDANLEWTADIPRLVLFVAHQFNDKFRFYSELEMEHTTACKTCPGAFEVEQAMVDYRIGGDVISARAGLILIPMGIINQWHEPPIFHGVVRPRVDQVIIPTTWRDLGAGVFGNPTDTLRYELYALTGLNPMNFSADGLRSARMGGALAEANAFAVTGRIEWEPLLGWVFGASGYYSDVGENGKFYGPTGKKVDLSVPVIGWDADVRYRRAGFEWRAVFAEWHLPEADTMMVTRDAAGKLNFDPTKPVPTLMRGGYVEAAYDVFRPLALKHQLLPFARLEAYNTQAGVPAGYTANPTYAVREYTFGLTYRPIQQIVVKADYQLRNRRLGLDEKQLNFGLGFMY
jgi:hypothetical protein